jgi:hypothetical protein
MFDTPEWREKEARAIAERAANAEAQARGEPMPFPNPWDAWDPTKVAADATPEQITQSYRELAKRCRVPTKRDTI